MKKWWIAAFALLLCAGCGSKSPAPAKEESAEAQTIQAEEAAGTSAPETDAAEGSPEAAKAPEETAEEASEAASDSEKSPLAAEKKASENRSLPDMSDGSRDVENNGGNFVRVGNRVYFRNYTDGGLPEIALFGEFLNVAEERQTSIWYYDQETGETGRFYDEKGFGPLWYGTDGFYLTGVRDGVSHSFFYPDGIGAVEEFGPGLIKGVSEDGQYAAFWTMEGNGGQEILTVLRGTESAASVRPDGVNYSDFCGIMGPETIWLCHGDDGDSVWELNGETGEFLCLGLVPKADGMSWAEVKQFVPDGNDFFLMLGWYEGTGHFLADYACMKGTLGKEDSLSLVTLDDKERNDTENPPKLLLTDPGEVMPVERVGGEVELTDYYSGDLIWCDSPFGATRLIPNFIEKNPYDGGDKIIQAAEVIGDAAYLIVASVEPSPEDDIGWRTAYRQTGLEYLRVPLQENSTAEHLLP